MMYREATVVTSLFKVVERSLHREVTIVCYRQNGRGTLRLVFFHCHNIEVSVVFECNVMQLPTRTQTYA